jgi:hypothetical protein
VWVLENIKSVSEIVGRGVFEFNEDFFWVGDRVMGGK